MHQAAILFFAPGALFLAALIPVASAEPDAQKEFLDYYDVPREERLAWAYAATVVSAGSGSFGDGVDTRHIYLTLWRDKSTLRVRILKTMIAEEAPEAEEPPKESFDVTSWAIPYTLENGEWVYAEPPDPKQRLKKEWADSVKEAVLDNVFVPFPEKMVFEKGFGWGDKTEDSLETFSSDTRCRRWEVAETQPALKDRPLAIVRSVAWDALRGSKERQDSRLLYREKTAHYDTAGKRVRFAWEHSRTVEVTPGISEPTECQYQDVLVSEAPGGELREMFAIEGILRREKEDKQPEEPKREK